MVDSDNTYGERVSRLVGWGHWFAFFNIIAAMLIGTRYIVQSNWPEGLLGQVYLAVSWVGHFGFLVFAIYLLIVFPLTFLIPSRKLLRLTAVCLATSCLTLLLIDTQTYQALNLHITPMVWDVLFSESDNSFSRDLTHLFILVPAIFILEVGLSEWVWKKQRKLSHKHVGRPLAAVFFLCFIASHLIYSWSDASLYTPVTSQRSNFPLSYPMTAKSFMEKHGLFDRGEYEQRLKENPEQVNLVNYPLDPIEFSRRPNKLNVLVVSVNNLRADMVTPELMPSTYNYAAKNQLFTNHYSSSNDMYGLFGLFYGLPSSYARSIKVQGSLPILFRILEQNNYQFGLFSGDNFSDAIYSETIFRGLTLQRLTPETDIDSRDLESLDQQSIAAWADWVEQQTTPWFSYLELATLQNYAAVSDSSNTKTTAEKLKENYESSIKVADQEVAHLLSRLEQLDNTLVVITSNHGMEFNETNTNSWGSNTNYSKYQLKVPMIIHWPGKVAATYMHRSSHLDLSVSILQDVFGVSSNPSDYSSGRDLFDETPRRWILAGDAREMALITGDHTTVVDKFGNFKVYDENYRRLKDENPTLPVLMHGLTELQRFYSKDN
jgi:membrane-anchored protein YejM (alkaline phosphatase superfamily)